MYASTAEIALLLSAGHPPRASELQCGYQREGLCAAREVRPLGCRMYFCKDRDQHYQAVYERAHERITELHRQAKIPYGYVELTSILAQWRLDGEDKKR